MLTDEQQKHYEELQSTYNDLIQAVSEYQKAIEEAKMDKLRDQLSIQ